MHTDLSYSYRLITAQERFCSTCCSANHCQCSVYVLTDISFESNKRLYLQDVSDAFISRSQPGFRRNSESNLTCDIEGTLLKYSRLCSQKRSYFLLMAFETRINIFFSCDLWYWQESYTSWRLASFLARRQNRAPRCREAMHRCWRRITIGCHKGRRY